ncbi:MAG: hypothetical protein ACI9VT_000731, partial [Psychroserpens sp.]
AIDQGRKAAIGILDFVLTAQEKEA